jgi:hypothetical protein
LPRIRGVIVSATVQHYGLQRDGHCSADGSRATASHSCRPGREEGTARLAERRGVAAETFLRRERKGICVRLDGGVFRPAEPPFRLEAGDYGKTPSPKIGKSRFFDHLRWGCALWRKIRTIAYRRPTSSSGRGRSS